MFRILIGLSLALLCSCAPVETHVTRFHRLPSTGGGQTFAIVPHKGTHAIETSTYTSRIAAGFERYGWRSTNNDHPDYKVNFDYSISGGREVHGSVPIVGQTGGGTTFHQGSFTSHSSYGGYNSGSVSGTSYTPPTFGVVGSIPVNSTLYDRVLLVTATDRSGTNVLEARCTSTGSVPAISRILPPMIDSLFTDFPGISGRTKRYSRPPSQ